MKQFKPVAITVVMVLGIFCGVLYTSCSKDACKGVTCLNGSSCSGGMCTCKPGIGGNSCEIIYRNLYAFPYKGAVSAIGRLDTLHSVDSICANHTLVFTAGTDTANYNAMTVAWNDSAGHLVLSLPITLANNKTAGSGFTVTTVNSDTFSYSGTGNINTVSASMTLTRTHPHGSSVVVFSFNNLSRQ